MVADMSTEPNGDPASTVAVTGVPELRNLLAAAISTFLSHYFSRTFLKHGWFLSPPRGDGPAPEPPPPERSILELKTRFLYCVRAAIERLDSYEGDFSASSAYQQDRITDDNEVVSTPERQFADALLVRCSEIMEADIGGVHLDDVICGQFLRFVLRLVRQRVRDAERLKYLYLFCVWTMPQVLFNPTVCETLRRREVETIAREGRLPPDLLEALRFVRGGAIFPRRPAPPEPVDEGWDLEMESQPIETPKRGFWARLFRRKPKPKAWSGLLEKKSS